MHLAGLLSRVPNASLQRSVLDYHFADCTQLKCNSHQEPLQSLVQVSPALCFLCMPAPHSNAPVLPAMQCSALADTAPVHLQIAQMKASPLEIWRAAAEAVAAHTALASAYVSIITPPAEPDFELNADGDGDNAGGQEDEDGAEGGEGSAETDDEAEEAAEEAAAAAPAAADGEDDGDGDGAAAADQGADEADEVRLATSSKQSVRQFL